MSTQQIPLTYESVLALIQTSSLETKQIIQDVAKQVEATNKAVDATNKAVEATNKTVAEAQKKTDEQMKKTDEQMKKTDEQIERTSKEVSALGSKVGDMVEKLVGEGNLVEQFRDLGHEVKTHWQNMKFGKRGTAESGEIDLFMEDGDIAILVEVKTSLKKDDVTDHIERIEKYRRFVDANGKSGKRFVGAVAGTVIPEHVINFAHEKGLYVIIQSARAVEIIARPEGFRARKW